MHTAPAGTLRHDWAPQGFIVSFKLETDSSILRKKAEDSLDKWVQGVLGPLFRGRPQHAHHGAEQCDTRPSRHGCAVCM